MNKINDYSEYIAKKPAVQNFFDTRTNTISYVVADSETNKCAIIDSVMDYEPEGARVFFESADKIINYIEEKGFTVEWILETHVHADHLSAAPYLQEKLGGKIAIGKYIVDIQNIFGDVFNEGAEFERDGSQFDHLWDDGETFSIGSLPAQAIHTPGHTPADMVYVIGDAVFAGDTLFMPDFGTARADFPGGSAENMHTSAQKIFSLPEEMRMFMCHDYLPDGRTEYLWETTIGAQKKGNVQLNEKTESDAFISMRNKQDKGLDVPRLIIPAIQINMRGGRLPKKEENGNAYLKIPVNNIFSGKN